jgi:hypothetical protein
MNGNFGVPGGRFLLALMVLSLFGLAHGRTIDPRRAVVVDGKQFFSAELYLDAAADTIALKQAGMRRFQFQGRSMRSVRYSALIPLEFDLRTLPSNVTCVTDEPIAPRPTYEEYKKMTPAERERLAQQSSGNSGGDRSQWGSGYEEPEDYRPGMGQVTPNQEPDREPISSDPMGGGGMYNGFSIGAYSGYNNSFASPYAGNGSSGISGYNGYNGLGGGYSSQSALPLGGYSPDNSIFGVPASGTSLTSPSNPVRPLIGTTSPTGH